MHHGPAAKLETDHAAKKKAKIGVMLFFVYLLVYTIFVIIGLFSPELMEIQVFGKQNLAIVYGFGLIAFAVVLGFIYNMICTRLENKMNNQNKEEKK